MLLPKLEYLAPKTIEELTGFIEAHQGKAKILAGGTDIIPNMLSNLYKVDYLIDIGGVEELRDISYEAGKGLLIGAGAKLKTIEMSSVVQEKYPALQKAAGEIGSPQIRAMATLGGNTCNASPAADTPPALVSLGAGVVIAGKKGKREMLLEDFIQGNRMIDLKPDEYLEKFVIPDVTPNSACRFDLITLRAGVEIDIASIGVYICLDDSKVIKDARITMGSVAPVPLRASETEQLLIGRELNEDLMDKAAEMCASEAKPIDDIRASAAYRKHLIKVLTARTIKETHKAIELSSGTGSNR